MRPLSRKKIWVVFRQFRKFFAAECQKYITISVIFFSFFFPNMNKIWYFLGKGDKVFRYDRNHICWKDEFVPKTLHDRLREKAKQGKEFPAQFFLNILPGEKNHYPTIL